MIVINDAEIVANNSPEALFNKPNSPLIASFFGEFNVIDSQTVYAHQLKMIDISDLKAIITKSYFQGQNFLAEADMDGQTIFFEHHCELEKGEQVF